ncbi:MAG: 6,7-dimethyl-8-ribityllumazine synthase [Verrucomicrobiota bacterium]
MSNSISPPPRTRGHAKRDFGLVASQFNAKYVEGLVNHCSDELRALSPRCTIALHYVPGAFEIPIVVRELAAGKKADAIIALGVILEGHTAHAENLGRVVTDALQRVALEYGVPVIHAVLSLKNAEQARERCLEGRINRGTEAARAAVEIADVISELRAK